MLRAVQRSWFSYDFDVLDRAGTRVGAVDLHAWREAARLSVGGHGYVARHKTWDRDFTLEDERGQRAAVAEKPSALRDRFRLSHGGARYELRRKSPWSGTFVLVREGGGVAGSVRRKSPFGRETVADLPEDLPLEMRVFILWLVIVMRGREDSSS